MTFYLITLAKLKYIIYKYIISNFFICIAWINNLRDNILKVGKSKISIFETSLILVPNSKF